MKDTRAIKLKKVFKIFGNKKNYSYIYKTLGL